MAPQTLSKLVYDDFHVLFMLKDGNPSQNDSDFPLWVLATMFTLICALGYIGLRTTLSSNTEHLRQCISSINQGTRTKRNRIQGIVAV